MWMTSTATWGSCARGSADPAAGVCQLGWVLACNSSVTSSTKLTIDRNRFNLQLPLLHYHTLTKLLADRVTGYD